MAAASSDLGASASRFLLRSTAQVLPRSPAL
jgi:hypothetical protein